MTRDHAFDEDITSAEAFDTTLGRLILAAMRNGIDPRGNWVYRNNDQTVPDWETMIVELEKPDTTD